MIYSFIRRLNLSNSLEQLVSSYIYNQSRSHPTFKFMLENEDHDAQILVSQIESKNVSFNKVFK